MLPQCHPTSATLVGRGWFILLGCYLRSKVQEEEGGRKDAMCLTVGQEPAISLSCCALCENVKTDGIVVHMGVQWAMIPKLRIFLFLVFQSKKKRQKGKNPDFLNLRNLWCLQMDWCFKVWNWPNKCNLNFFHFFCQLNHLRSTYNLSAHPITISKQ